MGQSPKRALTYSASILGTLEAGGLEESVEAAVSEGGGGVSEGASEPPRVGGAGTGVLTPWPGVKTSQSSSALSPNICIVNDEGEREALSILITIENHFTLLNT